ncbi:opioid growth factor receptor-like protein [Aquabacterium commune]|uniref:Opioid growth factor receptor-like protein n=1 Tax=Aquabacterium commune TaxID=70586 RepID=A0A4R6REK1_9BURK|nr:opioid growth factor receptor-related protein [Aquabacterium commune]TDP84584.1 opioid growth factor receptor-like protein [Aquabacterium commune]
MTQSMESIRNYLGYGGTDHRQRTLDEALGWDDAMLESTHDFVQWWFPLAEPSAFSHHAPMASLSEFEILGNDERVRVGVERAMHRMLRFYGLRLNASGVIEKTDQWDVRSRNWACRHTHNDLRLTRMLKSLSLLGQRAHARVLLAALEQIVNEERASSEATPLRFWREALL